jgi:hypothetical protein
VGGEPVHTTPSIYLENAFGETLWPIDLRRDDHVAYEAAFLQPGECILAPDSLADSLVIELQDRRTGERARVQLDLSPATGVRAR